MRLSAKSDTATPPVGDSRLKALQQRIPTAIAKLSPPVTRSRLDASRLPVRAVLTVNPVMRYDHPSSCSTRKRDLILELSAARPLSQPRVAAPPRRRGARRSVRRVASQRSPLPARGLHAPASGQHRDTEGGGAASPDRVMVQPAEPAPSYTTRRDATRADSRCAVSRRFGARSLRKTSLPLAALLQGRSNAFTAPPSRRHYHPTRSVRESGSGSPSSLLLHETLPSMQVTRQQIGRRGLYSVTQLGHSGSQVLRTLRVGEPG